MIIEEINNEELQEVVDLDDTKRGTKGFGSSKTKAQNGEAQRGNEQNVKSKIQINEISARAFGLFY